MSKFFGTAAVQIKDMIVYKFEVFIWGILNPIVLAVNYFLWKAIFGYSNQATIGGFGFEGLVGYYALMFFVNTLTWTNIDQILSERVQRGTLVNIMLKPISTFTHYLYEKIGGTAFSFAGQGLPTLILAMLLVHLTAMPLNVVLFAVSTILAMFLMFAFVFFVGLSSFWLTHYSGLRMLRSGSVWFLSGNIVPLTFFPAAWQTISNFLPFQYMSYSPVQIFLGKYNLLGSLEVIAIQLIWLAIFLVLVHFGYKVALKRFSAVGQ
jgi:ABC-type uncharacterized transport system permease subunit